MDAKSQMEIVNNLMCDISEKLGRLTRQGVLSFEDSMIIMKTMNDKQIKWMKSTFDIADINEFYSSKI